MNQPIKAFIDTDVVISSLISKLGAAYLLVNNPQINKFISNLSQREIYRVMEKLKITTDLNLESFQFITLPPSLDSYSNQFQNYVLDPNDCHILAGAVQGGCQYLVTYNLKHYRINLIKSGLSIQTLTPAQLLQILRLRKYII